METYEAIKSKIHSLDKSILFKKRKQNELKKELNSLCLERKQVENSFQADLAKEERIERDKYCAKKIEPLEVKKRELIQKLEDLKELHKKEIDSLSEDNIYKNFSGKQEILKEINESSGKLYNVISDIVGKTFCKELENSLNAEVFEIADEDLQPITDYFNAYEADINKISQKSGKITKIVNKIQNMILDLEFNNSDTSVILNVVLLFILAIIAFFSYRYLFPFYILFLLIGMFYNGARHYKIFKIFYTLKLVRDNAERLESMFHQQILDLVEEKEKEINSSYQANKRELESELELLDRKIQNMSQVAVTSFKFDNNKLFEMHQVVLQQKDLREQTLNNEILQLNQEIQSDFQQKTTLTGQLENLIGKLQLRYLDPTKIGSGYNLSTDFFLDIVEDKPVFFNHPLNSSLFIYSDEKEVDSFVKLINLQLRSKMNPTAYTVEVLDVTHMGESYIHFKPKCGKNDTLLQNSFVIMTSKEEFSEHLKHYKEELDKRIKTICAAYDNLTAYNEYMLSINSLTESMYLIFVHDPDSALLSDLNFNQQIKNGGRAGLYYHVFIREDSIFSKNIISPDTVENFDKIYLFNNNTVQTRAKSWVIEKILERNS